MTDREALTVSQFGPQAGAYVSSAVHASGADLDAVAALAARTKPARALDLGCGGGHVAYALAPHARSVAAVDLSAEMLAAVGAEAARRGLKNIETVQAPAENLPFADGAFDCLVSRYSAHHWRDVAAGLREARRVLRPAPRLCSSTLSRRASRRSTPICRRWSCCATPRMCAITRCRNGFHC